MLTQENNAVVYGGFFVRLAAYIIDVIIIVGGTLLIRLPLWLSATFNTDSFLAKPLLFKFTFLDIIFYFIGVLYFILLIYFTGTTIGKKVLKLKVVSFDGEKLTLINVIYRETIGKYLSSLLFIGYIMIGVDTQKRGFHDMLCDTRVIYFHKVFTAQANQINPVYQQPMPIQIKND